MNENSCIEKMNEERTARLAAEAERDQARAECAALVEALNGADAVLDKAGLFWPGINLALVDHGQRGKALLAVVHRCESLLDGPARHQMSKGEPLVHVSRARLQLVAEALAALKGGTDGQA